MLPANHYLFNVNIAAASDLAMTSPPLSQSKFPEGISSNMAAIWQHFQRKITFEPVDTEQKKPLGPTKTTLPPPLLTPLMLLTPLLSKLHSMAGGAARGDAWNYLWQKNINKRELGDAVDRARTLVEVAALV